MALSKSPEPRQLDRGLKTLADRDGTISRLAVRHFLPDKAHMRFLVIDDHTVVREGVAALLREHWPDADVGLAASAEDGLTYAAASADIDLVILDLILPGSSARTLIEDFGSKHPALPLMILSSSERPADVRDAIDAGALGYVAKSAPASTMLAAIRLVLDGEIYVPNFMAQPASQPSTGRERDLTARQMEILDLARQNLANKEIGYRLGISEKTVKAHLTAAYRILGVGDRIEAAKLLNRI